MRKVLDGIPLPNSGEFFKLVKAHGLKYDEKFITERAEQDAAQNIPNPELDTSPPFEKQLLHETSILASKIVSKYKQTLELLDAKVKAEEDFVSKEKRHTESSIESYSTVEEEALNQSHILRDAHKQLDTTEKRFNELYEKLGRAPIVYIPHWLYLIFAFLIFAGEIPLNALVFQIFGENQVMTWIMAVIIGLCVPLTAHFIGIKYRESEGSAWANIAKGTIALAIIVGALYGLSVMRQTYLGEFKEALGLTDTLVESSFMFFWLNIAVLGAAIMIAYLSHDPVPGYQKSEELYHAARKRLQKLEKRRVSGLKSSRIRKTKLISKTNRYYRNGLNRVNYLKGYYDMILKEGQELEHQCLLGLNHDIEMYRQANLRSRSDGMRPNSFEVELSFPLKLNQFEEKLTN